MLIQLPDDAVSVGYKEVRPYHYAQIFHSPSRNFTGTEVEFLQADLAYAYVQIDNHTRLEK